MPSLVDRVWADAGLPFRVARAALTPAAWTFEAVTRARSTLYDHGVMRARRASMPVVSVGNLRVGGTGKTPLVMWLVERLAVRGVHAAVVARGYGTDGSLPTVISTDAAPVRRGVEHDLGGVRRVHAGARGGVRRDGEVADEALLVALRTQAAVVTAVDRYEACRLAALAFDPGVVLLDDGFQHRRLWRDLDIVLVDPSDRTAPLLPAGPLREPWRAVERADFVISTARTPAMPYFSRSPAGLVREVSATAELEPLASIAGVDALVVTGIARSADLVAMLRDAGAHIREVIEFRDHHRYTDDDWARIAEAAGSAQRIITTEKDLVKLSALAGGDARLGALRIDVELQGGAALVDLICTRVMS